MTKEFLLEIGLEEVPAHLVTPTARQLVEKATAYFKAERISFDSIQSFSTPRRLALCIKGLAEKQEDIKEIAKGPAKKIAQDAEGNWSKAATGFARGQGASVDDLFFEEVKGTDYVFVNKFIAGKHVEELLPGLSDVVSNLTFPISMHWGSGTAKFIRPVHWLVALLEDQIIPMSLFSVASGRVSRGHRFLGKDIQIKHAGSYEDQLAEEFVIVDAEKRKNMISQQINDIAASHNWQVPLDANLLEEVTNLVEYPTAFVGDYSETYLSLPSEVLITSMKEHQRYFEVLDQDGKLLNHFVAVRNGNKDYLDNVIKGNEKVLKARLDDGNFFYEEDLKVPIIDFVEKLKQVTFHEKIGTMYEKMNRVKVIAKLIGQQIGLSDDELNTLDRVTDIYKFDLVTLMVDEFPELQGIIGENYALKQGETPEVSQAIREHYLPKSSDGSLPESRVGAVLAIADKADSLLAFFSVGLSPTGSNDPYALRRQAYGIIRIVEDKGWEFPLETIQNDIKNQINEDIKLFGIELSDSADGLATFIKGRMKQWFTGKDIRHDIIEAVVESDQDDLNNMFRIADILKEHALLDDFKPSVESLTRVINISSKAKDADLGEINTTLFENDAEKALYTAVEDIKKTAGNLTLNETFNKLKSLNPLIEAYFEQTMVMVEDEKIRKNRLNQLNEIAKLAISFASLDRLIVK